MTTIDLPLVQDCSVSECSYNNNGCAAGAVTIGYGRTCSTFVPLSVRGGLERKLGRHLQECLDPALARLDGGKGGLGHLGSGKVASGNTRGDLGGGKGIEALRHYSLSPSPKMDGTRK